MVWTVRYFKYCQWNGKGRRKRVDNDREGATGLMAYAVKTGCALGKMCRGWDDKVQTGNMGFGVLM